MIARLSCLSNKAATVDVTTLYFESYREDNLRKTGRHTICYDSTAERYFLFYTFFAFKTWQRSSHFTDAELAAAFQAILDANLAMVTGSEPRLALENLVRRIAGTGGRS